MNYRQCIVIVNDNLHLVGRYLDDEGQLVVEPNTSKLLIREVITAPADDALGLFKSRYEQSRNFELAISAWRHNRNLQVNLWVEDLNARKFAFLPIPR